MPDKKPSKKKAAEAIDLQTFITQTIIQIAKGVNNAAYELGSNNSIVNPGLRGSPSVIPEGFYQTTDAGRLAQLVEFDVAITASDNRSKEGGGGISVAGVNLGGQGQTSSEQQSVSRVIFKVPMALPKYAGNTFKVSADME